MICLYNEKLLFRKEVDYTLFKGEIDLPIRLNGILGLGKYGTMLRQGQTKDILIYLDGDIYEVGLINSNYSRETGLNSLKIIYPTSSDLYNKFKTLYESDYQDFLYKRKGKNHLKEKKEYINIYMIRTTYSIKHMDIYYIDFDCEKGDSSNILMEEEISSWVKQFTSIMELLYFINRSRDRQYYWIYYVLKFHEFWGKNHKNSLLNYNGKHIWGNKVVVDLDKGIKDIFNKIMDKEIIRFFYNRGKKSVRDIEERDLIQLIYNKDFQLSDFKRLINNLFLVDKKTEGPKINDNVSVTSDEKDHTFTLKQANSSINNIRNELNYFLDLINNYSTTVTKLNNEIALKNKEISRLENTIKELRAINESRQYADELREIKGNLKEIKNLLKEDYVL